MDAKTITVEEALDILRKSWPEPKENEQAVIALIERLSVNVELGEKLISFASERLSYIAWCSEIPGDGGTHLDHAQRWLEKSIKAREALKKMEEMSGGIFHINTGGSSPINCEAMGISDGKGGLE